jgi:hypothetical protein
VAADERGMSSTVLRLLRGYLLRSAWLYAVVGVMQFLLTDLYWLKGFARVSVPAALLGLWGFAAAINAYSLVWRSLPISSRDASVFRWWAIAGAPCVWIALCDSIAWASRRTPPGWRTPAADSLFLSILVGFSAVGMLAVLPSLRKIGRRFTGRTLIALIAAYALWLIYGLPTYPASPAASLALIAVGLGLLAFSGVQAVRGKLWRWPDIASGRAGSTPPEVPSPRGPRFGVGIILLPLLKQTLVWALAATGGVVLLYQLFPGAGAWLFWSYFIAISTTGFLLTYQVRSSIQILRVLPLSAQQLAARLQLFGALPGITTLALALLVNGTLLHVKLDALQFATFALIVIASQALPIPEPPTQRVSVAFFKWSRLFQRLYVPFYLGIATVNYGSLWAKWWWSKWLFTGAGVVLCIVGYYTLVRQLRSGIRPASNEGAFSAR